MTDQTKVSRLHGLKPALPDVVAVFGFGLLTRGLWLWLGEPRALTITGTLLLVLALLAVLRGDQ